MIDDHLTSWSILYHFFHLINAGQDIEVQATDNIGLQNQFIRKILVTIVLDNILGSRHPLQKVRKSIRNNYMNILILRGQEMIQSQ